jgi:short-subunit dehydrogenase
MELADTPVSVLIVAPSFVNTSIVNSPANVAACISSAQLARLQTYYRLKGLSPQAVAEMIVRAVEGRRQFVAIGLPAKLGLALMRISRRVGRRLAIHWSRKIGFA